MAHTIPSVSCTPLRRLPGEPDRDVPVISDSDPRPLSHKELMGDGGASVDIDEKPASSEGSPSIRGLRAWKEDEDVREASSSHSEFKSESFGGGEEPQWTSRLSERRDPELDTWVRLILWLVKGDVHFSLSMGTLMASHKALSNMNAPQDSCNDTCNRK